LSKRFLQYERSLQLDRWLLRAYGLTTTSVAMVNYF